MPGSIAAAGHVSRGDVFLMAERKNRMERARLDQQLRMYDRDCARNEFLIESQKRNIVNKWRSVTLTTGHSNKALPPSGPKDSVYESSKHGQFRLSEKRVMECKARERQLEKFLRQYEPRPTRNHYGFRPQTTPTSHFTEDSTDKGMSQDSDTTTQHGTSAKHDPVLSAGRARKDCHPAFRRRCISAVNLSIRSDAGARLADLAQNEPLIEDVDNDESNGNYGGYSARDTLAGHEQHPGNKSKRMHLGIRSLSTASFHDPLSAAHSKKGPTTATSRHRTVPSDDLGRLPLPGKLAKARASEDLRSSTQDYKALVKARHVSGTRFFITKENVVMTNAVSQTCRELRVSKAHAQANDVDDCEDSEDEMISTSNTSGSGPVSAKRSASKGRDENMSVSSLSTDNSEEIADCVFVPLNDHATVGGLQIDIDPPKTRVSAGDEVKDKENVEDDPYRSEGSKAKCAGEESGRSSIGDQSVDRTDVERPHATETGTEQRNVTKQQLELELSKPAKTKNVHLATEPVARTSNTSHKPARLSLTIGYNSTVTSRGHSSFLKSREKVNPGDLENKVRRDSSGTNSLLQRRRASVATLLQSQGAIVTAVHTSPISKANQRDTSSPTLLKNFFQEAHGTLSLGSPTPNSQVSMAAQTQRRPSVFGTNLHPKDHRSHHHQSDKSSTTDESESSERPTTSQWRRDLAREQPAGLRSSISSLGTVIKAAMVFSKAARRRTLLSMVEEHNVDAREVIRKERLRVLQSRTSVLSKIMSQFPVQGDR